MSHAITFQQANHTHEACIFAWLDAPHVQEFWDTTPAHRSDILNFMAGRQDPSTYCDGKMVYWVALHGGTPFGLLMTEHLTEATPVNPEKKALFSKSGHTYGIEFMIGNVAYLGRGYGALTLKAFMTHMKEGVDSNIDTFLIDPAADNPRALHVYQKAGFMLKGAFIMQGDVSGAGQRHYLLVKHMGTVAEGNCCDL